MYAFLKFMKPIRNVSVHSFNNANHKKIYLKAYYVLQCSCGIAAKVF